MRRYANQLFSQCEFLFKFVLAFIFMVFAICIFTPKPKSVLGKEKNRQASFFRNDLITAGLNSQAVLFWIFAVAIISRCFEFEYIGLTLMRFCLEYSLASWFHCTVLL